MGEERISTFLLTFLHPHPANDADHLSLLVRTDAKSLPVFHSGGRAAYQVGGKWHAKLDKVFNWVWQLEILGPTLVHWSNEIKAQAFLWANPIKFFLKKHQ